MMENLNQDSARDEYARKYPAWILLQQAAEIAQTGIGTIYDWSSRGLFDAFKSRRGRRVRLNRDSYLKWLFDQS